MNSFVLSLKDLSSVERLCVKIAEFENGQTVIIDFRDVSFLEVSVITAIAAFCGLLQKNNLAFYIKDPINKNFYRYLTRIGFYNSIGLRGDTDFCNHNPNANFVPICAADASSNLDKVANRITSVIKKHSRLAPTVISVIDYSFNELFDNIGTHAMSSIGGFVSSQYYPPNQFYDGRSEICICDGGIGIPKSLSSSPEYRSLSSKSLLLKSFERGVGADLYKRNDASYEGGQGNGLSTVSNFIKSTNSELVVVSHEVGARISSGIISLIDIEDIYYPGTVISMKVNDGALIENHEQDIFGTEKMCDLPDSYLDALEEEDGNTILW